MHVYSGLVITVITGSFALYFNAEWWSILIGFGVGNFIGFLKEWLWDYLLGKGNPDKEDFIATMYGTLIGVVVLCPIIMTL